MPDRPEARAIVAAAIRDRVRIRDLGPKALDTAGRCLPLMLNLSEAEDAADAALDAIQGQYVPPPPGDDRAKLPDHLLALLMLDAYVSTACKAAGALRRAVRFHPDKQTELEEWAERMHASCRLADKFTMQPCACWHHSEQTAPEEQAND